VTGRKLGLFRIRRGVTLLNLAEDATPNPQSMAEIERLVVKSDLGAKLHELPSKCIC